MPNSNNNITRICFYALWMVLCCIQAYSTGLLADEAYYWKYAQHLNWGYFDHPPVIAAIIKPGYALLKNELGVRLVSILMSTGFLYLLELLTQPKKLWPFYFTLLSIGAFHFLGYLALPDMPLLFFTALFLYLYRLYLYECTWLIMVLLAITSTLLLLSKYHGILVIGFTILAYPKILLRSSSWFIVVLSGGMFTPHIWWQFMHDFPSVKYHLSERSTSAYTIDNTLNYIASALLMFSPLAGIVLAWHAIKNRTTDVFERTLKWILTGTLLFFFVMTFKGRAEANWVAIALVPAVVLGYRRCEDKTWFPKLVRVSFIISVVLIIPLRAYLMYDFLPDRPQLFYVKETLHHTKKWAHQLEEKAGDRPVAFMNKYQYAAWYEFYTGKPSISLNNRMGRKNQYNIWDDEYNLQGENIMLILNYKSPMHDSISTAKGSFNYEYIDNFRSASKLFIEEERVKVTVKKGEVFKLSFAVFLHYLDWKPAADPNKPAVLHAVIFKDGKFYSDNNLGVYIKDFNRHRYDANIKAPAEAGTYTLYLDVVVGTLPPAINGNKIILTVY